MKTFITKFYRIIFALLILTAIGAQLFILKSSIFNFFSYFTILSNLFLAIVFILSALGIINQKYTDFLRGAATAYVVITGIGFIFLLGGNNDELIPWVNIVLHYISPIIAIFDWIYCPSMKLSFKKTVLWFLFLIAYLIYSLVRGAVVHWYPYPFLDSKIVGINGLVGYITGLLILSIILIWIIQKLSKKNLKVLK